MKQIIIDVREPFEYAMGNVSNSINIPLGEFISTTGRVTSLSKSDHIVLYCNSGNRSNQAIRVLQNLGYKNLTNGINKTYLEQNYPNST